MKETDECGEWQVVQEGTPKIRILVKPSEKYEQDRATEARAQEVALSALKASWLASPVEEKLRRVGQWLGLE